MRKNLKIFDILLEKGVNILSLGISNDTLANLCYRSDVSVKFLEMMCKSNDDYIKTIIAGKDKINSKIINILSEDSNDYVLEILTCNKKVSKKIIRKIFINNPKMRARICKNYSLGRKLPIKDQIFLAENINSNIDCLMYLNNEKAINIAVDNLLIRDIIK